MNQTTLLHINQSCSEMAETKIIHPSNFSSQLAGSSFSRPLPINQPRERNPEPNRQIKFYSPRNETVFRRYWAWNEGYDFIVLFWNTSYQSLMRILFNKRSSKIEPHKVNSFLVDLTFIFAVRVDGLGCEFFIEIRKIIVRRQDRDEGCFYWFIH